MCKEFEKTFLQGRYTNKWLIRTREDAIFSKYELKSQ